MSSLTSDCVLCGQRAKTRGLCNRHYMKAYRAGTLDQYQPTSRLLSLNCHYPDCGEDRIYGGGYSSRYCVHHKYVVYVKGDAMLDEETGLFADEDPSALEFTGNGSIICNECGIATSAHGAAEFCVPLQPWRHRRKMIG